MSPLTALKPGELSQRKYAVSILDLVVMMHHVAHGATNPDIGFEDCARTLEQMVKALNKRNIYLERPLIESALWSANEMGKLGTFWHPLTGMTFDRWARDLVAPDKFNSIYGWISSLKDME